MKKLLVIDDDPSICETLRLIGVDSGYDVTTTINDHEFRNQYTALQPDVVSLDLNLITNDGIEILRWLSLNVSHSKIIIISGYDEKILNSTVVLCESLQLDIVAAFHKPIDAARLKSTLIALQTSTPTKTINQQSLDQAIKMCEFTLYYQPQLSLVTGKIVGVEALVRWHNIENNIILPESFIPLAEETGLIFPLSAWINHEAMKRYVALKNNEWDLKMSINISPKLLSDLGLPDALDSLAKKLDTSTKHICLEISELASIKNIANSIDILTRLRIKGFSISIDDFGTGHTSLMELHRTPCTELKIHESLITDLKIDTPEFVIVRAIINLGHEFGLTIVAEGVETADVLEILKTLGCDIVQGYYIAKPMPAEELNLWLGNNVDNSMKYSKHAPKKM